MSKEITLFTKKITPLVERAESFEIKDQKDMIEATEMLSQMNKIGDAIDAEKRKVVDPLNQALKAERARWKPIETMYDNGIALLRKAMSKYQTAETARAKADTEKIAGRVGEGRGKLKPETAMQKIDELEKPQASVATDSGMVKFRTVKKFEVMDMTMLPLAYHVADESAIRAKMQAGEELPGVRYWEEQVPINIR